MLISFFGICGLYLTKLDIQQTQTKPDSNYMHVASCTLLMTWCYKGGGAAFCLFSGRVRLQLHPLSRRECLSSAHSCSSNVI